MKVVGDCRSSFAWIFSVLVQCHSYWTGIQGTQFQVQITIISLYSLWIILSSVSVLLLLAGIYDTQMRSYWLSVGHIGRYIQTPTISWDWIFFLGIYLETHSRPSEVPMVWWLCNISVILDLSEYYNSPCPDPVMRHYKTLQAFEEHQRFGDSIQFLIERLFKYLKSDISNISSNCWKTISSYMSLDVWQ